MSAESKGGAVEAARDYLKGMKPTKGASVEDFAANLFFWQMEIYSSYAGRDLDQPFEYLDKDTKAGWMKAAREHPHALPEWKKDKAHG